MRGHVTHLTRSPEKGVACGMKKPQIVTLDRALVTCKACVRRQKYLIRKTTHHRKSGYTLLGPHTKIFDRDRHALEVIRDAYKACDAGKIPRNQLQETVSYVLLRTVARLTAPVVALDRLPTETELGKFYNVRLTGGEIQRLRQANREE